MVPSAVHFEVKKELSSCFQDDRPENSGRSPVCHIGVSDEGGSSSTPSGLLNDCKEVLNEASLTPNDCNWVFNQASLTPWCHAVVHFEVKMSRFSIPCTLPFPPIPPQFSSFPIFFGNTTGNISARRAG